MPDSSQLRLCVALPHQQHSVCCRCRNTELENRIICGARTAPKLNPAISTHLDNGWNTGRWRLRGEAKENFATGAHEAG